MKRPVAMRCGRAAVAALVIAATSYGCATLRRGEPEPPRLVVERVELLPDFDTNAQAWGRDAGNSIRMGSEILWVWGDTFTWSGLPCATAARSRPETPHLLHEPVDTWFGSLQFYPFSAAEAAYNESRDPPECCFDNRGCDAGQFYCTCPTGTDCGSRIAIWPGDLLPLDDGTAVQLYEKVWVGSVPWDFAHLGTGVALVVDGATTARRLLDASGDPFLLFRPEEPNFLRAVLVDEPVNEDGTADSLRAYLFAVDNRRGCSVDILVARVALDRFLDRAAYEFWNGNGWSSSLADAAPALRGIDGGLGSVTWNAHLQRYLSAFNDLCSGGDTLVLRTAPRPEGPWSEPLAVDIAPLGATDGSYAGQIHSSLGRGRTPVFTFYQPLELGVGRVRMGRLHLQ